MRNTLLNLRQVAEILSVSYERITSMARQNLLPIVRMGRQVRVDPEALEVYIAGGGKALAGGWRKEVSRQSLEHQARAAGIEVES